MTRTKPVSEVVFLQGGNRNNATLIPGNDSKLHSNIKCFGYNKFSYYRNNCPSRNGRDRELQGTNLLQVVDDTLIINLGDES